MKVRVVLIDDHEPLREMLTVMLRASGQFEVVAEAATAAAGLEAVTRELPDMVIIDLNLGASSGWEQLPAIKAAAPKSRVVVFSGSPAGTDAPPEAGLVDAFIEKGTSVGLIDHLTAAVADLLPSAGPRAGADEASGASPRRVEPPPTGPSPTLADIEVALRRFVRVAAHDLAQPLQVSYGYLELLRDQHADAFPPDAAAWLAAALKSLDRSRVFVREMLRYARVEPPRHSTVNLQTVAASVIEMLDADLPAMEISVSPDLPMVSGDSTQLAMVLEALLDNAVRHGRPVDDGEGKVDVSGERVGESWIITVSDTGPGIPEDRRSKVVEPFERGQGVARPGLGLAIARLIVSNHGGELRVVEAPGGGTAIRFTLPV